MQSSYQLDIIADSGLRPSTYQNGYFIQDYVYKGNGDLDEFNGTFLINSDFPEGTYAYFSTLTILVKIHLSLTFHSNIVMPLIILIII